MSKKPDLADLLRRQERKTPNNPWASSIEPPRIAYSDPTGNAAVNNVMREQRGKR